MFSPFNEPEPSKPKCRFCDQTFTKFNELIKHEATHCVLPPPKVATADDVNANANANGDLKVDDKKIDDIPCQPEVSNDNDKDRDHGPGPSQVDLNDPQLDTSNGKNDQNQDTEDAVEDNFEDFDFSALLSEDDHDEVDDDDGVIDQVFQQDFERLERIINASNNKTLKRQDELEVIKRVNVYDWSQDAIRIYNKEKTRTDYQCKLCEKHLPSKWLLFHHILKHKGEKPFKCQYCSSKTFCQAVNRNKHELSCSGNPSGVPSANTPKSKLSLEDRRFQLMLKNLLKFKPKFHHKMGRKPGKNPIQNRFSSIKKVRKFVPEGSNGNDNETEKRDQNKVALVLERLPRPNEPVYDGSTYDWSQDGEFVPGTKKLKCLVCDKIIASVSGLWLHKFQHLPPPFSCKSCNLKFRNSGNRYKHEEICKGEHRETQIFVNESFPTDSEPVLDLKTYDWGKDSDKVEVDGKIAYSCLVCKKNCASKSSIFYHRYVHYRIKPYKCKYCVMTFTHPSNRNNHQEVCKSKPESPRKAKVQAKSKPKKVKEGNFESLVQSKSFSSLEPDFEQNQDQTEDEDEVELRNKMRNFDWTKDFIKIGIGFKKALFKCLTCQRVMSGSRTQLNVHVHTHTQTDQKGFKCKKCHAKFNSYHNRNRHFKSCLLDQNQQDISQEKVKDHDGKNVNPQNRKTQLFASKNRNQNQQGQDISKEKVKGHDGKNVNHPKNKKTQLFTVENQIISLSEFSQTEEDLIVNQMKNFDWSNDFQCSEMGSEFTCLTCNLLLKGSSRFTLKMHTFSHTGEKPFCCRFCQLKYASPTNRKRHEVTCSLRNVEKSTRTKEKFVSSEISNDWPKLEVPKLDDNLCRMYQRKLEIFKENWDNKSLLDEKIEQTAQDQDHESIPGGTEEILDNSSVLGANDGHKKNSSNASNNSLVVRINRSLIKRKKGAKFGVKKAKTGNVKKIIIGHPEDSIMSKRLREYDLTQDWKQIGSIFKCKICSKTVKTRENAFYHKLIHTREFPYSCNYCKARFRFPANRIHHEKQHTTDKSFTCCFCDRAFWTKDAMAQHQLSHSNEKTFSCDICHLKFKYKTGLCVHRKNYNHYYEKPAKDQNKSPKIRKKNPDKDQNHTVRGQNSLAKDQNKSPKDQNKSTKSQITSAKDRIQSAKVQNKSAESQIIPAKDQNHTEKDQNKSAESQIVPAKDQIQSAEEENHTEKDLNQPAKDQNHTEKGQNPPVKDQIQPGKEQNPPAKDQNQPVKFKKCTLNPILIKEGDENELRSSRVSRSRSRSSQQEYPRTSRLSDQKIQQEMLKIVKKEEIIVPLKRIEKFAFLIFQKKLAKFQESYSVQQVLEGIIDQVVELELDEKEKEKEQQRQSQDQDQENFISLLNDPESSETGDLELLPENNLESDAADRISGSLSLDYKDDVKDKKELKSDSIPPGHLAIFKGQKYDWTLYGENIKSKRSKSSSYFKCILCSKLILTKWSLFRHHVVCHKPGSQAKSYVGAPVPLRRNINRNINTYDGHVMDWTKLGSKNKIGTKYHYKCFKCSQIVSSSWNLCRHYYCCHMKSSNQVSNKSELRKKLSKKSNFKGNLRSLNSPAAEPNRITLKNLVISLPKLDSSLYLAYKRRLTEFIANYKVHGLVNEFVENLENIEGCDFILPDLPDDDFDYYDDLLNNTVIDETSPKPQFEETDHGKQSSYTGEGENCQLFQMDKSVVDSDSDPKLQTFIEEPLEEINDLDLSDKKIESDSDEFIKLFAQNIPSPISCHKYQDQGVHLDEPEQDHTQLIENWGNVDEKLANNENISELFQTSGEIYSIYEFSQEMPKIKRSRGRPRKIPRKLPNFKRSRGRPRIMPRIIAKKLPNFKRSRGRPRKLLTNSENVSELLPTSGEFSSTFEFSNEMPKIKRSRGRPRKMQNFKRSRGRPKKHQVYSDEIQKVSGEIVPSLMNHAVQQNGCVSSEEMIEVKRSRGRPKKNSSQLSKLVLYKCNVCLVVNNDRQKHLDHVKICSKKLNCDNQKSLNEARDLEEEEMLKSMCDFNWRDDFDKISENIYQCKTCLKKLKNKSQIGLQTHLMRHWANIPQNLPFACQFCSSRFISIKKRNSHENLEHQEQKLTYCMDNTDSEIVKNENLIIKITSPPSPDIISGFDEIKKVGPKETGQKLNISSSQTENDVSLIEEIDNPLNLKTYDWTKHGVKIPGQNYKCLICSKVVSSKSNLFFHNNIHSGATPYACPRCDRKFRNPINRKTHLIKCTAKAKRNLLRSRKPLKISRSRKIKTKKTPIPIIDQVDVQDQLKSTFFPSNSRSYGLYIKSDSKFYCKFCTKLITYRSNVARHVRENCALVPAQLKNYLISKTKYIIKKRVDKDKSVVYKCEFCPKYFTFAGNIKRHQNTNCQGKNKNDITGTGDSNKSQVKEELLENSNSSTDFENVDDDVTKFDLSAKGDISNISMTKNDGQSGKMNPESIQKAGNPVIIEKKRKKKRKKLGKKLTLEVEKDLQVNSSVVRDFDKSNETSISQFDILNNEDFQESVDLTEVAGDQVHYEGPEIVQETGNPVIIEKKRNKKRKKLSKKLGLEIEIEKDLDVNSVFIDFVKPNETSISDTAILNEDFDKPNETSISEFDILNNEDSVDSVDLTEVAGDQINYANYEENCEFDDQNQNENLTNVTQSPENIIIDEFYANQDILIERIEGDLMPNGESNDQEMSTEYRPTEIETETENPPIIQQNLSENGLEENNFEVSNELCINSLHQKEVSVAVNNLMVIMKGPTEIETENPPIIQQNLSENVLEENNFEFSNELEVVIKSPTKIETENPPHAIIQQNVAENVLELEESNFEASNELVVVIKSPTKIEIETENQPIIQQNLSENVLEETNLEASNELSMNSLYQKEVSPNGRLIFKCLYCPNIFIDRGSVPRHLRLSCLKVPAHVKNNLISKITKKRNNMDKPFKCELCSSDFAYLASVSRHQNTGRCKGKNNNQTTTTTTTTTVGDSKMENTYRHPDIFQEIGNPAVIEKKKRRKKRKSSKEIEVEVEKNRQLNSPVVRNDKYDKSEEDQLLDQMKNFDWSRNFAHVGFVDDKSNRILECTNCGKEFVNPSNTLLNIHQFKHDRVKPFKCTVCPNKSFSSPVGRNHHERLKHSTAGGKIEKKLPSSIQVPLKTYTSQRELQLQLQSVEKDKEMSGLEKNEIEVPLKTLQSGLQLQVKSVGENKEINGLEKNEIEQKLAIIEEVREIPGIPEPGQIAKKVKLEGLVDIINFFEESVGLVPTSRIEKAEEKRTYCADENVGEITIMDTLENDSHKSLGTGKSEDVDSISDILQPEPDTRREGKKSLCKESTVEEFKFDATTYDWTQHGDKVPNTSNKYQCLTCRRIFGHKSGLFHHSLTHTGEKPYSCKKCAQRFRQPTSCTRHELNCTKESKEMMNETSVQSLCDTESEAVLNVDPLKDHDYGEIARPNANNNENNNEEIENLSCSVNPNEMTENISESDGDLSQGWWENTLKSSKSADFKCSQEWDGDVKSSQEWWANVLKSRQRKDELILFKMQSYEWEQDYKRIITIPPKNYKKCLTCHKMMWNCSRSELFLHKSCHDGILHYTCLFCPKKFQRIGLRSAHEEKRHQNLMAKMKSGIYPIDKEGVVVVQKLDEKMVENYKQKQKVDDKMNVNCQQKHKLDEKMMENCQKKQKLGKKIVDNYQQKQNLSEKIMENYDQISNNCLKESEIVGVVIAESQDQDQNFSQNQDQNFSQDQQDKNFSHLQNQNFSQDQGENFSQNQNFFQIQDKNFSKVQDLFRDQDQNLSQDQNFSQNQNLSQDQVKNFSKDQNFSQDQGQNFSKDQNLSQNHDNVFTQENFNISKMQPSTVDEVNYEHLEFISEISCFGALDAFNTSISNEVEIETEIEIGPDDSSYQQNF